MLGEDLKKSKCKITNQMNGRVKKKWNRYTEQCHEACFNNVCLAQQLEAMQARIAQEFGEENTS